MDTHSVLWITVQNKRFCFHIEEGQKIQMQTMLLVERMQIDPTDIVLDLTPEFGAEGIVAATLTTQGHVHMLASDKRQEELLQENASLNFVQKRIDLYIGEGITAIDTGRMFDKVLFSMPDGMKKVAFLGLLQEIKPHLKLDGTLYISIPEVLRHAVRDFFEQEYGNCEKIVAGNGAVLFSATRIESA